MKIQTHTLTFTIYFFFLFFFLLHPHLQSTNYKNSKINKYYIKQFENYKIIQNNSEQCQTNFWSCQNSGGAWASHTSATGGAWVQENLRNQGGLERLPPLFTFLPAVRIPVTCKRRKHTQTSWFYFFIFTDLLLVPLFFSSVDGSTVKEILYFGGHDLLWTRVTPWWQI